MPPLDLTGLRPSLNELILVDTCEVWRDQQGATDDVTDPVTGSVGAPDRTLLQTTPCKIKPVYRAYPGMRGGEPIQIGTFELSKPADGILLRLGDGIKMTASPHHPEMVGRWFRVSENLYSSLGLFVKVRLEVRERPDDRP